jgi:hypothetical protein
MGSRRSGADRRRGRCDRQAAPEAVMEPSYSGGSVLVERAWAGGVMWELVKPRPPGLGAVRGHSPCAP